jgi:uncharacterized membrane protein
MKPSGRQLLIGALAGAALVAYAAVAHYTSVLPQAGHWAVLLAVAPIALIALGMVRRAFGGAAGDVLAGLLGAGAIALLAWAWPRLQQNVMTMYFIQHVGINGSLALLFGRSLVGGRQPLCGLFASVVHPTMTPAIVRYTRQVTVAWTGFFLLTATTSVLLFFLAPAEVWSVFANVLSLPLVALMFVVENEVRKRVLPASDQIGIAATLAAYRKAMALRARGNGAQAGQARP